MEKGVVAVRGVEEMMRTCILDDNVHHQVVSRQLPQWDLTWNRIVYCQSSQASLIVLCGVCDTTMLSKREHSWP
jgi:hypothetical protein